MITDIRYGVVEEKYEIGNDVRFSYGIVAYSCLGINNSHTIIASVHDVSADKEETARLVELCNRLSLAPEHLADVAVDWIS